MARSRNRSGVKRTALLALAGTLLAAGCTSVVSGVAAPPAARITTSTASTFTSVATSATNSVATTTGPPTAITVPSHLPSPVDQAPPGTSEHSASSASTPRSTTSPQTSPSGSTDDPAVADQLATSALTELAADLRSGDKTAFLSSFSDSLHSEVGDWFSNTRALGVSGASFTLMTDRGSETATTVKRTFTLGVRTPYDNDGTMPSLYYQITLKRSGQKWMVTAFAPDGVDDPMYCECTMKVDKRGNLAVVHQSGSSSLDAWPGTVLDRATEAAAWDAKNLPGKDLTTPKGHVFFLAEAPYHWFLSPSDSPQENNSTIPLAASNGDYSSISRVVLMLRDSANNVLDPDDEASLYVWDVVTHEMVHQLFYMDSMTALNGDYSNTPTWVQEGIAVAAEVLHRRQHERARDDDFVFPLDDDIANISSNWLTEHLDQGPPTTRDLYDGDVRTADNWYAVAGSVFLWVQSQQGSAAMVTATRAAYDGQDSVFDHIPDVTHPGKMMSAAGAKSAWIAWVKKDYLS